MGLNAYTAEKRKAIYEDLRQGLPPREGEFSEAILAEGKAKGMPQMGTARYEPHAILVEFIYPDPAGAATILTVRLKAPERIIFLPVPPWVIESIWQGEIDGSYHFESQALALVDAFKAELASGINDRWFGPRQAIGRS